MFENGNNNENGASYDYLFKHKNQRKTLKKYAKKSVYQFNDHGGKKRSTRSDQSEQYLTDWHSSNIDECVQETLLKFRDEVFLFYKTDNIDESQMFRYLKRLNELTLNLFQSDSQQRSIFDISTVIDTLFYLVFTQVTQSTQSRQKKIFLNIFF